MNIEIDDAVAEKRESVLIDADDESPLPVATVESEDESEGVGEPVTPEARRRSKDVQGIEAKLGDGLTWTLGRLGLSKLLSAERDRIFEDLLNTGNASPCDLMRVLWYALKVNYLLTGEELKGLVVATDVRLIIAELAEAAIPTLYEGDVSFDQWARAALLSCGIRPGDVPADDLPLVLRMLVRMKKIVNVLDFTGVGQHLQMKGYLLSSGKPAKADEERAAILETE